MSDGTRRISRREFVTEAGATAAASGFVAGPALAAKHKRRSRHIKAHVAVLGGGMGGLTAAHELAERGFKVTVVEPKALGGKARSIPVPGTGRGGRRDLPGEHGFRFFPGFYKNIPDTMRRIPVSGNPNGAFDNLVDASQELIIFNGNQRFWTPPTKSTLLQDYAGPIQALETLITLEGIAGGVPANEIAYFVRKMQVFFTSCDARRVGEWEYVGWWEFVNAEKFSPEYQRVFGNGLTKDLVAAKGHKASSRTIGLMAEAFVYDVFGDAIPGVADQSGYAAADRLLDAPTNEAWIKPWVAHLRSLGVRFITGRRASRLKMRRGMIAAATLSKPHHRDVVLEADWFVLAMPVEQAVTLLNQQILAADPSLARLRKLETDWMNGIQYFLNRPPGLQVKGHVAFIESPWALTSIDQGLFWKRDIKGQYGNGQVTDIYSVDISDFFTPGVLYGKAAADCTPQQIAADVWAQMKQELNTGGQTVLADDMIVSWFLDPAIHYPNGQARRAANREPLLINTAGSLDDRPTAHTRINNLFLASDYVRTNVDLATMEGANEAGRQAANALLHLSGSHHQPARLGALWQPAELDAIRNTDATRYRDGQPNVFDLPPGSPV